MNKSDIGASTGLPLKSSVNVGDILSKEAGHFLCILIN